MPVFWCLSPPSVHTTPSTGTVRITQHMGINRQLYEASKGVLTASASAIIMTYLCNSWWQSRVEARCNFQQKRRVVVFLYAAIVSSPDHGKISDFCWHLVIGGCQIVSPPPEEVTGAEMANDIIRFLLLLSQLIGYHRQRSIHSPVDWLIRSRHDRQLKVILASFRRKR